MTRSAPAPLPASRPHVLDEAPHAGHRRWPKETLGGISTSCYVVLVRGESDELTLDSLRVRERQNRYFTASRNDPPPLPNAILEHTRETEENERHLAECVFFLYDNYR